MVDSSHSSPSIDHSIGHVFQINISGGGVPKMPIQGAMVHSTGVEGDRQRHLKVHGGPDRALCVFSLERILALQQQGHPIIPGSTGENLTLTGLDWDLVRPGIRLAIGDTLKIEITDFTEPCSQIAASFANGEIVRILQDRNPGWSRVYAKVLEPGGIAVGDRVGFSQDP